METIFKIMLASFVMSPPASIDLEDRNMVLAEQRPVETIAPNRLLLVAKEPEHRHNNSKLSTTNS